MWNDKGAPPDLPEAVTVLRMHNASLNNRWTRVGEHVHTDAVLNLDDDVFVNKQGLVCMYNWWSTHRSRLVGPFVRKHHGHGQHLEYSQDELFGRHDYSMVLPKVLMLTPNPSPSPSHSPSPNPSPNPNQVRGCLDPSAVTYNSEATDHFLEDCIYATITPTPCGDPTSLNYDAAMYDRAVAHCNTVGELVAKIIEPSYTWTSYAQAVTDEGAKTTLYGYNDYTDGVLGNECTNFVMGVCKQTKGTGFVQQMTERQAAKGLFACPLPVVPASALEDPNCRPNIEGCMNKEAVNYDSTATSGDQASLCNSKIVGCMDSTDVYYYNLTNVHAPEMCAYFGCMDSTNCNYDPTAVTHDQGACEKRVGCTDSNAFNYDAQAVCDSIPPTCIAPPVLGCMDPNAWNYDSLATGKGECVQLKRRCCNTDAVNYNCPPSVPGKVQTVSDDARCKFLGCTDSTATDYNPTATHGDPYKCEAQKPKAGEVGCTQVDASQYKLFATRDDVGPCEIFGCSDSFAVNYNPRATVLDGSCDFAEVRVRLGLGLG